jgi:hypothetical protein
MVEFINALTGTLMQVPDDRKEEYLAAGHKLAAETPSETKEPAEAKTEKSVKTRTRTTAKK